MPQLLALHIKVAHDYKYLSYMVTDVVKVQQGTMPCCHPPPPRSGALLATQPGPFQASPVSMTPASKETFLRVALMAI